MADNVTVDNAALTDYDVRTDEDGSGKHYQLIKLAFGPDDTFTRVEAGVGLPVGIVGTVPVSDGGGSISIDDNSGSITVDGTVTLGAGTANIGDVDVLTVPAPLSTQGGGTEALALRVTIATDSTGVLSVDDNGATLSIDDGAGSITVDGTVSVSGTVTVDSELPAAAALADNTSNPTVPGVGAFAMVWDGSTWDRLPGNSAAGVFVAGPVAVDSAVGTRPVGAAARASTAVPTAVDADGDAVHVWADRRGAVKTVMVDDAGDSAMDGTNNALRVNVVAGSGAGVTHTDDAAFTPATDDIVPIGGFFDDVSPDAVDEGDAGVVRMTSLRALHVNLRDNSGAEVSVGGGTQYDEDTAHTAAEKVTMAGVVRVDGGGTLVGADLDRTELSVDANGRLWTRALVDSALPAGSNNIGDVDVLTVPAPLSTTGGGTEATALRVTVASDSTGVLSVDDNGGSLTVDGTVAVSGTVTVSATDLDIRNLDVAQDDVRVGGMAAFDAAVADNPVAVGGRGSANNPTQVSADGDAVWLWLDREGAVNVTGRDAHDGAIAGITKPLLVGGRASTATPTAVSADGDAAFAWLDRRGAQKIVMVDDAGDSIMDGTNNALNVNVVAGAAGGVQYTEGATDASITGTAMLFEGLSDDLLVPSEANPLPIIITDGTDVAGVSSDNKLRVETVADDTEDSAVTNGQGGFVMLGVRNDAAAARTDADGDASWLATDSAGRVGVADLGGSITVDGTVTVNQGTAGTAWEVVGDVAHDAAAPANPVVVGGQMETIADSAPGTRAGTDGDAVKLASLDGAIFQAGRGPQSWQTRLASTSTVQTDGSIHSAPGSGLSLYVTDIIFSIGVATASSIFFEEGASTVLGPWYLEAIAGRGMALHFQTPFKVTANTALTVTNTGATTYSILVLGFTAPG